MLVDTMKEADKYAIDTLAKARGAYTEAFTRAEANKIAAKDKAAGLQAQINAVGAAGPDVLNLEIAKYVFPQLGNITAIPYSRAGQQIDLRHLQVPDTK